MKLFFALLLFKATAAQSYNQFSTYCLEGKQSAEINASITETDQWSTTVHNGYDELRGLKCLRNLSNAENIAFGVLEGKFFSCALYNIRTKGFTFKSIGSATTSYNGYVEPNFESCIQELRSIKH